MSKLFVGNLSWSTSEDDLKAHFEQVGEVVTAKIVTDKNTGKSKGFGFVEMKDNDAANEAIEQLNDKPLLTRNLRVSLAQERQSQGPGQGGGGGRPYRGGGGGGGDRPDRRDSRRSDYGSGNGRPSYSGSRGR